MLRMQSSDTENCTSFLFSLVPSFFSHFCILFDTSSQRIPLWTKTLQLDQIQFSALFPPLWLPGHPDVFHPVLVCLASRLCVHVFSLSLCCMCMFPCCVFVFCWTPVLPSFWSHWDLVSYCWLISFLKFLLLILGYLSPMSLSSWYKPGTVTCSFSCTWSWVKNK